MKIIQNMPLISVILPTYNRIITLPRAVDSVLHQTYPCLELIIVDDGSSDGTQEYVKGLQDKRVIYHRNECNMGPSAARNAGVELARGEYIAFQDSDDEFFPTKLQIQMLALRNGDGEKVAMVYHELCRYEGKSFQMRLPARSIPYRNKTGELFPFLLLNPLISTQTMMIEKKAFKRLGGFRTDLKSLEDYEFSIRFAKKYKIKFIPETLVKLYDSNVSVGKRLEDKIHTQAVIVRDMCRQLMDMGMLRKKVLLVKMEAELYDCRKNFYQEMEKILCEIQDRDIVTLLQGLLELCNQADGIDRTCGIT